MKFHVLIVDDEEMIRENLKAYLEDEGLTVVAVESGEEALQCLKSGYSFAVCIMDMRLPGIDGNASIRNLHTLCSHMSFIIHTGSSNYALPDDFHNLGISKTQLHLKPLLDMAPLAAAVRTVIERSASMKNNNDSSNKNTYD